MNKKLIKVTESDLHGIIKESVNKILKEFVDSGHAGKKRYNTIVKFLDGTEKYVKDTEFFKCCTTWKQDYIALSKDGRLFNWAETRDGVPVYYEDEGYLSSIGSLKRWREENM